MIFIFDAGTSQPLQGTFILSNARSRNSTRPGSAARRVDVPDLIVVFGFTLWSNDTDRAFLPERASILDQRLDQELLLVVTRIEKDILTKTAATWSSPP